MRKKSELKRNLRKGLGDRLAQLRHSLEMSRNKMASTIDIHRVTFQRNEEGRALPEISTLFKLSETYDVSMDWLLFNKGPMVYKEKAAETQQADQEHDCMDILPKDYRELLEYMDKLPILRYEILLHFRKYLQDNSELPGHAPTGTEQS
jgi:transcriptional regulator with XRE-family HTH domain